MAKRDSDTLISKARLSTLYTKALVLEFIYDELTGPSSDKINFKAKRLYLRNLGLQKHDLMRFESRNLPFYREARKELRSEGLTVHVAKGLDGFMTWDIGVRKSKDK